MTRPITDPGGVARLQADEVERIELVFFEFGQLRAFDLKDVPGEGLRRVTVGDLLESHDGEIVVPAHGVDGEPHLLAQPQSGDTSAAGPRVQLCSWHEALRDCRS